MCIAKVIDSTELAKLKIELAKTAKRCSCEGCENIGIWHKDKQCFYLQKGMCGKHYQKYKAYGDPLGGKTKEQYFDGRMKNIAYKLYMNMLQRCENPNNHKYPKYGGVGITVSEEFHDFPTFLEYIGERPSLKHSIDRYPDKAGNYERGNIRWATIHQQSANQKSNNETVGVTWEITTKKWRAQLTVNKVYVLRKRFDTYKEAVHARKQAEIKYNITI